MFCFFKYWIFHNKHTSLSSTLSPFFYTIPLFDISFICLSSHTLLHVFLFFLETEYSLIKAPPQFPHTLPLFDISFFIHLLIHCHMFVFLDTEYPVLSNKHLFPTSSTPSPFLTINLLIHLLLTSNLHYFETHKLINCHYYKFITLNTGIIY